MTSILAIDPGSRESAYVELVGDRVLQRAKVSNMELLSMLRGYEPRGPLVVEMMAPYGRIVGRDVFRTLLWTGRYLEAWRGTARLLERREVKKALGLQIGHRGSTDADVRAALIQRWGGKAGKRQKAPDALVGVTKDIWAALAVAVAWQELHGEAFAAVEEAPLGGLEELNRALGLTSGVTKQELQGVCQDPVYDHDHGVMRCERKCEIPVVPSD